MWKPERVQRKVAEWHHKSFNKTASKKKKKHSKRKAMLSCRSCQHKFNKREEGFETVVGEM